MNVTSESKIQEQLVSIPAGSVRLKGFSMSSSQKHFPNLDRLGTYSLIIALSIALTIAAIRVFPDRFLRDFFGEDILPNLPQEYRLSSSWRKDPTPLYRYSHVDSYPSDRQADKYRSE